jgi:S-adenosylmethionine/arginine decarboxylase-like enzyme
MLLIVKNQGNRGITAISVIETSHIAMHVWDEPVSCT